MIFHSNYFILVFLRRKSVDISLNIDLSTLYLCDLEMYLSQVAANSGSADQTALLIQLPPTTETRVCIFYRILRSQHLLRGKSFIVVQTQPFHSYQPSSLPFFFHSPFSGVLARV